ncbi:hypothetical protein OIU79_006551 [Salix purpurea]|uniref:Uncharacterized protein n=1 Tax=Salix purpurea TaxID=77065 RepID=A0A9Q0TVN8_SALPP|nr:hypothetical protein OIU79_006551 [Salix purpurea]
MQGEEDDETESTSDSYENINAADINKDGVPQAVGFERDVDGMRIHQAQDSDFKFYFFTQSAVPSPSVSRPSCIRPNEGPIMIRNMPAAGCKSIIPATSLQMVLRRRKRKAKLVTSVGSLQQSEDVCEVESESSMDSGIRQGNLRFSTSSCAAASESVVETEVQGILEAGIGMLRTCRSWQLPLEAR